jgi:predicted double-glycine peptidase
MRCTLLLALCGGRRAALFVCSHLEFDFVKRAASWPTAGVLILAALLMCGSVRANGSRPVQSVLEIRRERVMIQKWDLSCGAAALGTLLRYQFGEPVAEKEIARALMSRAEYVGHPELLYFQEGFSLLDLKRFIQTYRAKQVVSLPEKKTRSRMQVASLRPTTSRTASNSAKRSGTAFARIVSVYKGEGLGKLDLRDLIERAPIMVPINALGYHHFVVVRGIMGNRVLIADPAWGNRTMTTERFQRIWLDYGEPIGHVGFVVERADGHKIPNRLEPKPSDFVMLQ